MTYYRYCRQIDSPDLASAGLLQRKRRKIATTSSLRDSKRLSKSWRAAAESEGARGTGHSWLDRCCPRWATRDCELRSVCAGRGSGRHSGADRGQPICCAYGEMGNTKTSDCSCVGCACPSRYEAVFEARRRGWGIGDYATDVRTECVLLRHTGVCSLTTPPLRPMVAWLDEFVQTFWRSTARWM